MIPRIGWEVLVQFLDGDPDRPIVLGHFYNPIHTPEVALPDNKTATAHRSSSSPGAGGLNEVYLDDAAGAQQLKVAGHYDINVVAANNKQCQVTVDQTQVVGNNRTVSIGSNENIALTAAETVTVGGDQSLTVGANRTVNVNTSTAEEVTGDVSTTIGAMENMMVGSPIQGVLEVITAEAISAAAGAAASAAQRAASPLMGPIMPALNAAQSVVGPALQFAGPASAMLGGSSDSAVYGSMAGSLSNNANAQAAGGMSTGIANSIVTGSLAESAVTAAADAVSGGGSGGGGDGGGGGGGATGNGTWTTEVGGDLTDTIGALAALSTVSNIGIGIGGNNTETIGAARIELIKNGKVENVGTTKTETTGTYVVKAKETINVDAKAAIAITVASQKQKIGKGHAVSGGGVVAITTSKLDLKSSGKISLICGAAKVVIDSSGVDISGPLGVTVQGTSKVEMKAPAILPGV